MILPLKVQQRLDGSRFLRAQRFHLANHDQVVARDVFGVNFAIQPVQATVNDRASQRRTLPLNAVPFVRALPSKPVGYADLIAG